LNATALAACHSSGLSDVVGGFKRPLHSNHYRNRIEQEEDEDEEGEGEGEGEEAGT